LTLPPGAESARGLPAIVMPHGGPSARDEWGFDWLSQFFASRGFAVLQPNFRGSSGYGDAWFRDQGFKSWQLAIGDVLSAGRWLVSQGDSTSPMASCQDLKPWSRSEEHTSELQSRENIV